ncbi:ABC transporter substrate-binding protein [Brevibacillus sp. FSL L8-0520]|uniref:ABC transporter substrate-binding protein n=1 Tax=Brevibacillus TaxID=55080 RepID=UPI00046979E1|nr:ABC transporter substrate-binding protein [Brevibacillus borstelensis]KKX56370.1 hypothetical protein X546_04645 [Brevibacillus borstelensis cifa_chp40]
MKKNIGWILAALMMLVAALSGCSRSSEEQAPDEITLSESWDFSGGFYPIETLVVNTNFGPEFYMSNFYETLVNYRNGEIVPGLAESWDISDDGKVYTFHLRQNVKFSDGTPFDAEAVKRNLEVIPINLGKYNGYFGTVSTRFEQIVVVDANTVEVHLTAPYYGGLKDFSLLNPMAMVSPNAFHEDGSVKDTLKTVTLGTGPYMYRGDRDGNIYTFVRNPHYWGEPPEVERFHVKVIPDNHARLLAFRNGEVDLLVGTRQISFDGFNEMKAAGYGALVSEGEANYTRFLAFDVSKAPFDDLNVRLAVSYAIDKMSIVQNIFAGIETKADSILDPALPYCDVQLVPRIYDRQQAIALLENAGWVDADGDGVREKDGVMLKGEILYIKGDPMIDDLILVLAAQLKEIGMEMKGNGMEKMAFHAEYAKGVAITLYQTYGNPWDPHTTISNMKPDLKNDYPAAQALALVKNGNDIIQRLNVTTDEKEIRKTYHFVLSEIHDKATLLPISYTRELALHNTDKIKGYTFYAGQPSHFNVAGIKLK